VAFKDIFQGLFKSRNPSNSDMKYAKFINGEVPIFSQFGKDIYANDVVQICIDIIASELSKLQPKHIRTDKDGMRVNVGGSINRLFKFAPNPLMTTRDFIEKIIWQLMMNYNSFIYPTYENIIDSNGKTTREYTGFYPLNPTQVDFLQDAAGKLFIKFYFLNSENFTLPYEDIIHLRKKFSVNEIMGGGRDGQPNNDALLKVLEINDTVLQGLEKGIKASLCVRGILNIKTMLDDDAQKKEREKFEEKLANNASGIVALDLKGDYIPLEVDPKLLDKETLEFLQNKILPFYGVSIPVFSGDFTDDQYQAFHEKTLETIIISLGQAFSKTIFTQRELDVGNEIVFYQKDLAYLSAKMKVELIKIAGEQGLFTTNEKLSILGYPPIIGGDVRYMSLNYIDTSIANQYQLNKSSIKEPTNVIAE
jgi:HK97 family phage portal protein